MLNDDQLVADNVDNWVSFLRHNGKYMHCAAFDLVKSVSRNL